MVTEGLLIFKVYVHLHQTQKNKLTTCYRYIPKKTFAFSYSAKIGWAKKVSKQTKASSASQAWAAAATSADLLAPHGKSEGDGGGKGILTRWWVFFGGKQMLPSSTSPWTEAAAHRTLLSEKQFLCFGYYGSASVTEKKLPPPHHFYHIYGSFHLRAGDVNFRTHKRSSLASPRRRW